MGLDVALRNELIGELCGWLAPTRTPVLSVTHDVGEAFQLGAEVIKIADGRVVQQGPVVEVLAEERARLLEDFRLGRKTEHDWFLFELNAELGLNCVRDCIAECDQLDSRGVAAVHKRESVAGGDRDSAHGKTFAETRFFYEPRCSELYFAFSGSILRNFFWFIRR